MDIDIPTNISGKVLLYTSRGTGDSPLMTMRRDVTPNLPTILQDLSGRYSPIQSEL
jgi:hypothetical protein